MRSCRLIFLLLVFLNTAKLCFPQAKTDTLLQNVLFHGKGKILQNVLRNKDSFRVQIIYTRIDRDRQNHPSFRNYFFNTDTALYFNPASTVKLPLALLSLEKLNRLNKK